MECVFWDNNKRGLLHFGASLSWFHLRRMHFGIRCAEITYSISH